MKKRIDNDTMTAQDGLRLRVLSEGIGSAARGDLEEAIARVEPLLDGTQPIRSRLGILRLLIDWYGQLGQVRRCCSLAFQAVEEATASLPVDDEMLLVMRSSELYWMCEAGLDVAAERRFPALIEDVSRVVGASTPLGWAVRTNSAMPLKYRGDYQGAARIYREIADETAEALEEDDPLRLTAQDNLAEALAAAGHCEEALARYEAILDILLRRFPEGDWRGLRVRYEIARLLWRMGDVDAAVDLWSVLVEDCRLSLGDEDELTAQVRVVLSSAAFARGDFRAAVRWAEELVGHPPAGWTEEEVVAVRAMLDGTPDDLPDEW